MRITKKKMFIVIFILTLGLLFLIFGIILNNNHTFENDLEEKKELLGEDRIIAEDNIIEVINKYLDNSKIKEYLTSKNQKKISIKELKENLKVDISEFEKLKYGCNSELTTINYNSDYTDYNITLTCDVFFMEDKGVK